MALLWTLPCLLLYDGPSRRFSCPVLSSEEQMDTGLWHPGTASTPQCLSPTAATPLLLVPQFSAGSLPSPALSTPRPKQVPTADTPPCTTPAFTLGWGAYRVGPNMLRGPRQHGPQEVGGPSRLKRGGKVPGLLVVPFPLTPDLRVGRRPCSRKSLPRRARCSFPTRPFCR